MQLWSEVILEGKVYMNDLIRFLHDNILFYICAKMSCVKITLLEIVLMVIIRLELSEWEFGIIWGLRGRNIRKIEFIGVEKFPGHD